MEISQKKVNSDLTLIIYDQPDNLKYETSHIPENNAYKQKVVRSASELETFLEYNLQPACKVCFFIHAMTDKDYNMVEGENDRDDKNSIKPGGILKRKFRNLIINYVTTGSAWEAIELYRQRSVFNYNKIEEHIAQHQITVQRVSDFYLHKSPYGQNESSVKSVDGNLGSTYLQDEENLDRPLSEIKPEGFVIEGVKEFIRRFNREFVIDKIRYSKFDTNTHWSICLFPFLVNEKHNPLICETWNYNSKVFTALLEIQELEKNGQPNSDDSTLVVDCEDAIENIKYFGKCDKNGRDHQWEIKMNFFVSLVKRTFFQNKDGTPDYEKLSIAARLYLMHEILHKQFHDLDYRRSEGIGAFPRVIEEADFHADTFAILCEISHQGQSESDMNVIYRQIGKIIRTAIETTLSFGRAGITEIQVRRVNRYLIWLYVLRSVNLYVEGHPKSTTEQLILFIIRLLSVKPIVEITGPQIFVNKAKDRVSYRIDKQHITFTEQICLMNDEKKIIIKAKSTFEEYDLLYLGLRESNFESLYEFMEQVF